MDHGFTFRPGTNDAEMFRHIMEYDEYHLPAAFSAADVVIDIGVHIGTYTYKALLLGAGRVYGFEAEPENFACASRNLKGYGDRLRLTHGAVWRSDRRVKSLNFNYSRDRANTGGGNAFKSDGGISIPVIAFDRVLREATGNGRRRVRMLKIDCEGSEFPILMTSRRLHLIDEIAGEYHEFGGDYVANGVPERARIDGYDRFTIVELTEFLERAGFRVTSERHAGSNLGLFHAVREARGVVPRPALFRDRIRSAWRHVMPARRSA